MTDWLCWVPSSRSAAIEQCMFRVLDVVDPENVAAGPIIRLEHEVRSVIKADGTLYKSCPVRRRETHTSLRCCVLQACARRG